MATTTPRFDIQFLRMTHLRGPNIWTYRPVMEAWVDIGALEDHPSNTLPGFVDRLIAFLPGLAVHRCSVGVEGGFIQRLREGTWTAHILEHVALELQTRAGLKTGFGKAREAGPRGVYKVAIRCRQAEISEQALRDACEIILAAIHDEPCDVAGLQSRLTQMADSLCMGPSTASIVDAATDQKIPHIRLNGGNLVQLGYGHKQRRIWTAETDRTSAIAEGISKDKDLTKQLLSSCGIPVPSGRAVHSAEQAWEAAEDLGLPVCVKPRDGNHGRGITLDLRNRADVEAAYAYAALESNDIIVERYISGNEHRLLVVGSRLVAANRGEELFVIGDGQSSIAQLVHSQINTDPHRGEEESFALDIVRLNPDSLATLELKRQGLKPTDVLVQGRKVTVLRTGNLTDDVTDEVHPQVAAQVVLAARVIGLDIAGIDLVAEDISRPLEEQGGAIVEVNAGPGLLMHLKPVNGQPRPVGQAIVDHLITPGESARIPLVGLLGNGQNSMVARLSAWLLHVHGAKTTGVSCADGLYLNQRRLHTDVLVGEALSWDAAQRLLINRNVQAAVFEATARTLLTEGLPYDRCDVGVITQMPRMEGLQDLHIHRPEQMTLIARTQMDVVLQSGTGLINAEDDAALALAEYCDGDVLLYASEEQHPALVEHRKQQGRTLFWRGEHLVWQCPHASPTLKAEETILLNLKSTALSKSVARLQISAHDLMVAAGTAAALGIPASSICAGVKSFGA